MAIQFVQKTVTTSLILKAICIYYKYKQTPFIMISSSSSYLQQRISCKASTFLHVNGDFLFENMSPLSKNDLLRIFEKLDKNGNGFVSIEELSWLLEGIGVRFGVEDLEPLVGKQCLNFDEFLFFYDSISNPPEIGQPAASSGDKVQEEEEGLIIHGVGGGGGGKEEEEDSDLAEAFKVFDLNGDGFISSEELENVLGRLGLWDKSSGKDCRTMICFYDTNLDGMVDFQEFKNMMLHTIS